MQTMNQTDYKVYKPHTNEEIMQAVREFNDAMHDDADIEEIQAGLRCLDFLTQASEMDGYTESRVYGAQVEAEMRLQLLLALDADNKSYDTLLTDTIDKVKMMHRSIKSIEHMMRTRVDDTDVMRHIKQSQKARANL